MPEPSAGTLAGRHRGPFAAALVLLLTLPVAASADEPWQFGFAKLDITPTEPVRLSGYGSRDSAHTGVADPLHVRAMAFRPPEGDLQVLVSVDTIGFPAYLSDEIHQAVAERHGLARDQIVFCGTHSHTAPQLADTLPHLFATPLTEDEQAATARYTDLVRQRTIAAIDKAAGALAPGHLRFGTGSADFAIQRRVIKDGTWVGFGTDPEGPVDHSVPVLRIDDAEGRIRGIVFNYACHCTTLGADFNQISADWAGYAAEALEANYDGAIALPTIGCGADANPDARGKLEMAKLHGRRLSRAVTEVLGGPMTPITAAPATAFGYAGLPIERRDLDVFRKLAEEAGPQTRRHAQAMLATHQRMGRLPESYPAPVQTWRFGDQLAMVFLGGEVVSEYALRLQRELDTDGLWVSAYANDLFGYVASERMRSEGGYEVDASMVYYNQPGRWAAGTEDVLIRRVHELLKGASGGPLAPEKALGSFVLPPGYQIELVAAEPLLADPINMAFDPDGSLWVVEMGDYPLGTGESGGAGGRIRHLRDQDGDGAVDTADVFLDRLSYPNGVLPWRGGVFVSAAPEIFYAKDTDGDGRADEREVLFSGFAEANPQHRANGFTFGLDGWVYVAGGADNGEVTAHRTGETIAVGRRDFRFHPDRGTLEVLSGEAQYGRTRDAWGNWFANTNSRPGYHYVMEDGHLRRNPHVALPAPLVDVFEPRHAPPIFPASRTEDRFNDLFAANRFTSACSPVVFHPEFVGSPSEAWLLVCEPVHNLVHRQRIWRDGTVFRGERLPEDAESEFIASTDGWSRPVRVAAGPDGAVWVVDMYRHVIEHPQWIPEPWQARLNLRAGEERGRIYRVFRGGSPGALPDLSQLAPEALVARLEHPNAAMRDLAQQQLIMHGGDAATESLRQFAAHVPRPESRVQALGTLAALGQLTTADLRQGLTDTEPEVLRFVLGLVERYEEPADELLEPVRQLAGHPDRGVCFAAVLALARFDAPGVADALVDALHESDDRWLQAAVLSSARLHARRMLERIARDPAAFDARTGLLRDLLATAFAEEPDATFAGLLAAVGASSRAASKGWDQAAAEAMLEYLHRRDRALHELAGDIPGGQIQAAQAWLKRTCATAAQVLDDTQVPVDQRVRAVRLVARAQSVAPELSESLAARLSPAEPYEIQSEIVNALAEQGTTATLTRLLASIDEVSPRIRTQILLGIAGQRRGVELLADAFEAGRIAPSELDAAVRDLLLSAPDPQLRSRIEKLLASDTPAVQRSDVIRKFEAVDPAAGDASRGEQLFAKHCVACHRSGDSEQMIGPNLDGLTDRSKQALLTALFDPSAAIESRYRQYRILTLDGRLRAGVVTAESSTSITLGKADGTLETLLRSDIEQISPSPKSLMPEDLDKQLTPAQVADLLAHLQQPRS